MSHFNEEQMIGICVKLNVNNDEHKLWINTLYNQNSKRFCHKNLSEEFKNSIRDEFTFNQELCFDDEHMRINDCSRIRITIEYNRDIMTFNVRTFMYGRCSKKTSIVVTPQNKEYIENIYNDIMKKIDEGFWKWDDECMMDMFNNVR